MTGPAIAEIYKWVDEDGLVHFSSVKPESQALSEVQIEAEIRSFDSVSYGTSDVGVLKATPHAKVVIFSASWCGYCKKAKMYFKKKNIQYTDYDIEKSAKGKRLYKQLGAKGVPVILVGNKRMNGFSETDFERLYR